MIESLLLKINHASAEAIHIQFWTLAEKLINESELLSTASFIQHGNTTVLLHSIAVAYYSYLISSAFRRKDLYKSELITGALFHDYFLYDWHIADKSHRLHGFYHPKKALENTRKIMELTEREQNIIIRHMFPLTLIPPKYFESVLVCVVDKSCSVYETFRKDAYPNLIEIVKMTEEQKEI